MDGEPSLHDHERRIARLEAFTDARLLNKDVFDVWAGAVVDRLDKTEDATRWIMRFAVAALCGVILNLVVVGLTAVGR